MWVRCIIFHICLCLLAFNYIEYFLLLTLFTVDLGTFLNIGPLAEVALYQPLLEGKFKAVRPVLETLPPPTCIYAYKLSELGLCMALIRI